MRKSIRELEKTNEKKYIQLNNPPAIFSYRKYMKKEKSNKFRNKTLSKSNEKHRDNPRQNVTQQ